MGAELGPRREVAKMLTDAVVNELAAIDEAFDRIKADLQTLERWGRPLDLPLSWRLRLGLLTESAVTDQCPTADPATPWPNLFLSSSRGDRHWIPEIAQEGVGTEEGGRRDGLRAAAAARAASQAIIRDVAVHQEERSSIDYAVRVLESRQGEAMDVGEITEAMQAAGWRTTAKDVRNVGAAILGKAAEKYGPMIDRPGRGQYRWIGNLAEAGGRPPVIDLRVHELPLDIPSDGEETAEATRP